jgi:phosphate transport system substrate-binding protein
MKLATGVLAVSLVLALAQQGLTQERDELFVVGSSTVYPFVTVAAERFGQPGSFKTPKVEQTGTGGGIKLFCDGLGLSTPDIATASRRMTASEFALCKANGVDQVVEIELGLDAIVIAGASEGPPYDFSLQDLYLGLAQQVPDPEASQTLIANPYKTWAAISPGLENAPIQVYGPSPVHGTYDAFLALAMAGGCKTFPWIAALQGEDEDRFKTICQRIRDNGSYIEVSGNYNLVISKMRGNPQALGILGFNFLDQNRELIHAASIDGVEPMLESVLDGSYPLTRSLYVYAKKAHAPRVPGLQAFLEELTSDAASGEEGYLEDRGLIPLPEDRHAAMQETARAMPTLQPADLEP